MVRTLSIGHEVDFTTDSVDWETDVLFQDYQIVFVDLLNLDETVGERPLSDVDEVPHSPLPDRTSVLTHLQEGHDVVVVLPTRKRLLSSNSNRRYYLDLFDWIPSNISVEEESGDSLNQESVSEDWNWYFDGQSFEWNLYFERNNSQTTTIQHQLNPIVTNVFNRALACRLDFREYSSSSSYREIDGSVYLIPLLETYSYEDFLLSTLRYNFGEDTETPNESDVPEWVDEHSVPGENETLSEIDHLQTEISELESELADEEGRLADLQRYKGLLYGNEAFLEDLVPTVLREVGFEVEDEVPHNRDGLISLDDRDIVLEIHGTTNGISQSKCRQLRDWVNDYQDENPSTHVDGILIVNPLRNQPLDERNGALTPHTEDYMENLGYRFMRTEDVYKMLVGSMTDQLTFEEIREKFLRDDLHVAFDIDV